MASIERVSSQCQRRAYTRRIVGASHGAQTSVRGAVSQSRHFNLAALTAMSDCIAPTDAASGVLGELAAAAATAASPAALAAVTAARRSW